ncbi:hypothetical protein [Fimbriiglobus ruber]|uniref:Uncharacterized protein n=1 Tax=Fimbriiglobus ruber TaxID=1908690 RepID=A0A225E6L6_9BACT|nr:hypothetical protein [Fimbriiglobus ruber]OWK47404.1 hypothetical protein FRUB_01103 [Fimbriiglobus ruber]
MRNLLALVGLVVVGFCGLGYYLNWYSFAVEPGLDGKQHIQVDVDTKKITTDAKTFGNRVEKVVENAQKSNGSELKTGTSDFVGPPAPIEVVPAKPSQNVDASIPAAKFPIKISIPGPGKDD